MRADPRGSVAILMVGLLLPLTLFAISISIDLAAYFHERDLLQAELDRSALIGAERLPDGSAAESAASDRLATRGISAYASAAESTIELRLERAFRLSFASMLGSVSELPISIYARAGKPPARVVAALDRSRSFAPDRLRGEVWGDPTSWPAPHGVERVDAQRCFNPLFSPVKRTASLLAGRSTSMPGYSFTAVSFPGTGRPIDLLEKEHDELCVRLSEWAPYRLDLGSDRSERIWQEPADLDVEADFGVSLEWIVSVLLDPQSADFAGRRIAVILSADVPRSSGDRFPDGASGQEIRDAVARSGRLCRRVGARCEVLYLVIGDLFALDREPRLAAMERLQTDRSLTLTIREAGSVEAAWQLAKSFTERVYLER